MYPSPAGRRCPVCGQRGQTCGPSTTGVVVDGLDTTTREGPAMAELREYTLTVNGCETTMQLTERDAERLGATPVPEGGGGRRASSKARTAPNKARAAEPAKE